VSPNKHGRTIVLYRLVNGVYRGFASATIAFNSTYSISANLGRGNYYVRACIGGTPGNTGGCSRTILVRRS